ncbi:MAG: FeoB-associated Cys-rich membrane protein [Eubacteriaceae bacterium]|nr:FeoB-associated Cys-rich membrane protein [Eubacteriaceae bacterium]
MGDFLLLVPIILFTAYIVIKNMKNVKAGKCSCSESCSGCNMSCDKK